MKITSTRGLMLATTIVSSMTFAVPVFAQTTAGAKPAEAEVVVVTGSRIARRDGVAESPILTVGTEQLAESGYTTP